MEGVNVALGKGVWEVMWGKAQQDVENDQHCVCAAGPRGPRGSCCRERGAGRGRYLGRSVVGRPREEWMRRRAECRLDSQRCVL